MKPQTKLNILDRTIPLVTLAAGGAVAISSLHAMNVDLDAQVTPLSLIALAAALCAGYLVAASVDSLLFRALGPVRERLLGAALGAPEYPVAVADGIESYLSDLKAGLPLAVEMAGPEGEMPSTGDEWIAYRLHPYRLDALHDWHTERAA